MTTTRTGIAVLLFTFAGPVLAACGAAGGRDDASTTESTPSTPATPSEAGTPTHQAAEQGNVMRIEIAVGDQLFRATLNGSVASRDLIEQLPLTLEMRDHGSVEKTGRLPSPLSLKDQPAGADPDVGDVGYYAPGNDLVLYYGDQSYYPGIVVLGQMEGDASDRIADMQGTITVTITVAVHN